MFRIDDASTLPTLPALAAAGSPGYFAEGDLVAGDEATVVTADFLNGIQEELITILAAAAIAPYKSNTGQILQAMQKLFGVTSGSNSKGTWFKVGSLIIQMGFQVALTNQTANVFDFPIPFPTGVAGIFATLGTALPLTSNTAGIGAQPVGATQGQITIMTSSPGTTGAFFGLPLTTEPWDPLASHG